MLNKKRLRLKLRKNFPIIIVSTLLAASIFSNIWSIIVIDRMVVQISELEMSNTVIAMTTGTNPKKIQVVSDDFWKEYLPKAEGFRDTVYKCSKGDKTIGYGTNLSKNNVDELIQHNCMSVDDNGDYTMNKFQAKRAAGLWIAANNKYFERYSDIYIGIPFIELPQNIKDFIVLVAYKSGGVGLIRDKKELAARIGDFIDYGSEVESEQFENMILSAGGDQNRQSVYRSIFLD